jgi:hypothetical protein
MIVLALEQLLGQDEVGIGVVAAADAIDRQAEDRGIEAIGDLRRDAGQSIARSPA